MITLKETPQSLSEIRNASTEESHTNIQDSVKRLFEQFRVVPEDSIEGQSFHHLIEQVARELYKPESNREGIKKAGGDIDSEFLTHDFDKYPVRFLLADVQEKNACFIPKSNPPTIIINKGIFSGHQNDIEGFAYLAIVIAHEMTHLKIQMREGLHINDKMEETTADSIPVMLLYHSNFVHPKYCLSTIENGMPETFYYMVDEHPTAASLRQAYNAVLTNLERIYGDITPHGDFTQQDIYGAIVETAESARHVSHLDKIKEEKGYEKATLGEKVEILNDALLQGLSDGSLSTVRHKDILNELREILIQGPKSDTTKKEEVLQASAKIIEAADKILDVLRSSDEKRAFDCLSRIYSTYCRSLNKRGEITPIGSLEPLSNAVEDFIETYRNDKDDYRGISSAAKELVALYEKEALTNSEYGRGFLQSIEFDYFDEPQEKYVPKKNDYVYLFEWKRLREHAEEDLDIAKAAVIVGLGRDPKILEQFTSQSPDGYLEFKERHGGYKSGAITRKPALPDDVSEKWEKLCRTREVECSVSGMQKLLAEAFKEGSKEAAIKLVQMNINGHFPLLGLEYLSTDPILFFQINPNFSDFSRDDKDKFFAKVAEIRDSIETEKDRNNFIKLVKSIPTDNDILKKRVQSFILFDAHNVFDKETVFSLLDNMEIDGWSMYQDRTLRNRILELTFGEVPRVSEISELLSISIPQDVALMAISYDMIWKALAIENMKLIQSTTNISDLIELENQGWFNVFFSEFKGERLSSLPLDDLWPPETFERFSLTVSNNMKEYLLDPNLDIDKAIEAWDLMGRSDLYPKLISHECLEIILDKIEEKHNPPADTLRQCEVILRNDTLRNPGLRERVAKLYAKAFVEINGLDDNSEYYRIRVQNNLDDSFWLRMPEIFEAIAWESCAQRSLSYLLENLDNEYKTSIQSGPTRYLGGIAVDTFINYAQKNRDDRNALLDLLFSNGDAAAAIKFSNAFLYYLDSDKNIPTNERVASAILFYKTFHSATLAYRAVFLSAILTDKQANKILDDDFKKLIKKIIPDEMEYASEARQLLYNHLQTFETYSKDLLLASLLAANDPSDDYKDKSVGQVLTIFAENMGPAYIKVMQGVEGNPMLPLDLREDITKHAKRLKFDGARPTRWDLMHIIDDLDIRSDIEHVGEILGNASMNIAVDVTLKDGERKVLSLLRPYSQEKANFGFSRISKTADAYDVEWSTTIKEMAEAAKERAVLEADCEQAQVQYDAANSWYDGVSLEVNGTTYDFSSAHVDGCGRGYYFMNKIEGELFAELPERTAEEKKFKKECGIAILTHELSNILNGHFDSDRHSGQMKVRKDENGNVQIGHFDFKGTIVSDWSSKDYEQFVDVLLNVISTGSENSFSAHSFVQAEEELRKNGEEIRPLVLEVQKALFSLSEYTTPLEKEELLAAFVGAVSRGVCEPLQEAVTKRLSSLSPDMQAKIMQSFAGNTGLEIKYLN